MLKRGSAEIKEEIIGRFGFFPPFFEPALKTPAVLETLWHKTLNDYIENPLPDLFKEKLAALLARYCAVPYCLVCHSSTLGPLGMEAGEVLELLELPALSYQELAEKTKDLDIRSIKEWPAPGSVLEEKVLYCSIAIFLSTDSENCLRKLRAVLSEDDYSWLIIFILYNKSALAWAEAHPELSYEADYRAQTHLGPLLKKEPKLKGFFENYVSRIAKQQERRERWLTDENKAFVSEQVKARKELEAAVENLESEREVREKFVATLTHDLRTPMTAARLSAQVLTMKAQDPKTIQLLSERIVGSIDRADRMVRDLLDANRIKAGAGLPVEIQECRLGDVLHATFKDLQDIHGERFRILEEPQEIQGMWDADALQRVIENLASNAVKYGSSTAPIAIEIKKKNHDVEIAVHNEGNPISSEDQKTLFNPYRRTVSALSSGQKGWGIGLTLVRGLVEAHRGKVWVESSLEKGTSFFVQLPINK